MVKEKYKYRIQHLANSLPRNVVVTSELKNVGIPQATYYRDRAIQQDSKQSIPSDRLIIYASFFNVDLQSLFTSKIKVSGKSKSKTKSGLR